MFKDGFRERIRGGRIMNMTCYNCGNDYCVQQGTFNRVCTGYRKRYETTTSQNTIRRISAKEALNLAIGCVMMSDLEIEIANEVVLKLNEIGDEEE